MSPIWSKDGSQPEVPNVVTDTTTTSPPSITSVPVQDTIWNHTVIEVDEPNDIARVTINVPEDAKDRVIIETSIPKAAARISDELLSYVTKDAVDIAKFRSRSVDTNSNIFKYAKIKVDGELVEVNLDTPNNNDLDQILIRTSVPKASAMLTDNVAGSLLGATKVYKPFDGKK